MRVGVQRRFVSSLTSPLLLVGLVTIATIFRSSDPTSGQTGLGIVAQPPHFIAIDLNPEGFVESWATGASDGQQVGYGYGPATGGYGHALVWHGTATSAVDLHPRGFMISRALSISGGQQVGVGISPLPAGTSHAVLWRGSTSSAVDLNPKGFIWSEAYGISGGQQVGSGYGPATGGKKHAFLWRGNATSVVDLNPPGFDTSAAMGISGAQQVGWGSTGQCVEGSPDGMRDCHYHALVWRGTANGVVDLGEGRAYGTSGEQQVGSGPRTGAALWTGSASSMVNLAPEDFYSAFASATLGGVQVGRGGRWPQSHALLWRGSISSLVDLHVFLPPGFEGSYAMGIDSNGDIVGVAWGPATDKRTHAILWTQNVNAKPSLVRPVDKFAALENPLTPKALGVYTGSPVEFLLTDPLGNQSGFDPVTQTAFPGYEVSAQCDEQGSGGCEPPFKQLNMGAQMDGQYTVDVIGTGTGDFAIEVRTSDATGNWIAHLYSGTTAPGLITRFSFSGEVITFASFNVTLKINVASKMFEANGRFNLSPARTISPLAQPVTIALDGLLLTIPTGSFKQDQQGKFVFNGTVEGVVLDANLMPLGGDGYAFQIKGAGADLETFRLVNNPEPVRVMLAIGNNGGSSDVKIEYGR